MENNKPDIEQGRQYEFEKYPKLTEYMQEYASLGYFGNWTVFIEELNNCLSAARKQSLQEIERLEAENLKLRLSHRDKVQVLDDLGVAQTEIEQLKEQLDKSNREIRIKSDQLSDIRKNLGFEHNNNLGLTAEIEKLKFDKKQVAVSEERMKYMREQATNVFELTKGFTTQPDHVGKVLLELAGYVQELTNKPI